ncbi:conserved hypothetical protein [Talaromyces marneffei ATCC 18224]|uniref:Uncharacterized protein n=1 Tax=Talaromyces marneffei (strain ATCC 18224 / CBS 334.59 / QM 7333) TaxID=441960 RepID=B6Q4J6_TALMQ|nr:conserved hypothetical protein [Talaromyces marneffei ATCC 18224]
MSDVEKPVEEAPAVTGAGAAHGSAADQTTKAPTFLDKLSLFTIGKNRGQLPPGKATESGENAAPLTFWQKVKLHFRRYWICHLIVLIILLAILLPCLFLLIIPRIAQDLLNSGSIVIDSSSILQPTNNSVILSIASHIYIPGPFTVHTDPQQLQLYIPQVGSEYPMALVNLPAAKIHKNTSIGEDNQYTVFENYTSWNNFVHNTIFLNAGSLGMKGKVVTQLGKIKKFTLDLDKVVPSNGLNQFSGFKIDSASLVLPAESDGTNLIANATLPNQSVLTLEIGNTTLDIMAGNLTIGKGVIKNLYLKPGNNSVQIRGTANLTTILDNLGSLIAQQREYIRNGYLSLTTQVTDISYNGSTVPYYTEEMSKLALTAQTPLLGLLLNTLSGFLHSGAANTTNLTSILANYTSNRVTRDNSDDLLNNATQLEVVARHHLERLVKL